MSVAFIVAVVNFVIWIPVIIGLWDPKDVSASCTIFFAATLMSIIGYWAMILGLV